jgi:hypothetical protein
VEAPQLFVNQDSVTYDDYLAQYTNPNNYSGVFGDYFFENHYERDPHTYMASQTTETPFNGSTVGFVRIGGPTLLWVCEWTAMQVGAKPVAPSPVPVSSDWVLLDIQPTFAGESRAADGVSPLYRLSGVYVYGHKNPNADVYKDGVFPLYPWVSQSAGRQMQSSDFKQGLIDGTTGDSAGGGAGPGQLQGTVQVKQG